MVPWIERSGQEAGSRPISWAATTLRLRSESRTTERSWQRERQLFQVILRILPISPWPGTFGFPGPDFGLSFSTSAIAVTPGQVGSLVVGIDRTGGFTGEIVVTVPDTSAIRVRLDPTSQVASGATAVFNFKVKRKAPAGPQLLVFSGKDQSGRERTATLTMTIQR